MKLQRTMPNGNRLAIVATIERGYFSVTATEYERGRDVCGGCMHDEVLTAAPWLAPIVALHLSDAQTGAPMHAEANGWYWLAGTLGGLGQAHHGSNDGRHSAEDCVRIFAEHARIARVEARQLAAQVAETARTDGAKAARIRFASWIERQAQRWAQEAAEGRDLLASKAAQYAAAGVAA